MLHAVPKHPMLRLIIASFLLLALGMGTARAQDSDSTQNEQDLPDIAPQEVEIRGNLDISFPSLQRQPLVGFNPPPSTYEIPEDRSFFIEEYKQEAADLPNSPLQKPQPPQALDLYDSQHQGMLKLGGGRFMQRTAYGHMYYPVRERLTLYSELDYNGLQGHQPFENKPRSGFDRFDGSIGFTAERRKFQTRAELNGFYNTYTLYGAEGQAIPFVPQPERQGTGMKASVALESYAINPSFVKLTYGASRYETETLQQIGKDNVVGQPEKRLQLATGLNKRFNNVSLSFDGTATMGGVQGQALIGDDYLSYDTGTFLGWSGSQMFEFNLGARLLGYQGSKANGAGRMTYVSPAGELIFRPSTQLQLYVQNTPFVRMHSVAGLFQQNPYLTHQTVVQPSIAVADVEGGLRMYRGVWQFSASTGVSEYPLYRYFENAAHPRGSYTQGFFRAAYDKARIIHAGGRAGIQLPNGFQAALDFTFRQGRLTDNNMVIPYFAPLTSSLSLSYPFASNRGLLQINGTFHSGQFVDSANEKRVDAFVDFNAEASYDIVEPFGVYVKVDNMRLGAAERWAHYPRPPLVAQGGIRLFW